MPNIKSAKKRMRTSEEARVRNRAVRTRVKNVRRDLLEKTAPEATAPADDAAEAYRTYCSVLDKAAKKGTISRNTAIRRKRSAAARLRRAESAAAAAVAPAPEETTPSAAG